MTNINWIAEISNILIQFIVSAKKKKSEEEEMQ